MPKDEWLAAKRRDIARKAAGDTMWPREPSEKAIRRRRKKRKKPKRPLFCRTCKNIIKHPKRQLVTFKDKTVHYRVSCPVCKQFIKWEGFH